MVLNLEENSKLIVIRNIVVIIIVIIIVIIFLWNSLYVLNNEPNSVLVEKGSIAEEENVDAYIIREEKVFKGENYENGIVQIKSEGDKVANNETLFRYYSDDEEDIAEKIANIDKKIEESWTEEESTLSLSDIKQIDKEIENYILDISNTNEISKMENYKKQINNLITKKAKIAGEYSPKGSYLKSLVDERTKYASKLNADAEYIKTDISGIISYKIDGYEESLTIDRAEEITKEELENLNIKTNQIIADSNQMR